MRTLHSRGSRGPAERDCTAIVPAVDIRAGRDSQAGHIVADRIAAVPGFEVVADTGRSRAAPDTVGSADRDRLVAAVHQSEVVQDIAVDLGIVAALDTDPSGVVPGIEVVEVAPAAPAGKDPAVAKDPGAGQAGRAGLEIRAVRVE